MATVSSALCGSSLTIGLERWKGKVLLPQAQPCIHGWSKADLNLLLQNYDMTNVVHLNIPIVLLGRWRSDNEDGRFEYQISVEGGTLKVTATDFVDGEPYEVSSINYDRTMIAFDTLMPSTGRRGRLVLKAGSIPGSAEQTFTFTDTLEMVRQDDE